MIDWETYSSMEFVQAEVIDLVNRGWAVSAAEYVDSRFPILLFSFL